MSLTNAAAQRGTSPSHVQGAGSEALMLPSDMLRDNPRALMKYYKTYKLSPTFLSKLRVLGFVEGKQYPYIEHYEDIRPRHNFTVGSVITAATGAGQPIVIQLSADDMLQLADGFGYGSRPRETETVMFSDQNEYRITVKDITHNPHYLTITPTDKTVNANTAIVAGASAVIVGPIKGEGTGQVKGLLPRYSKYQNTFAIMDESDLTSGTFMTLKSPFVPVDGKPGYYYVKGIEDADIRHERNKSMRCVIGKLMNNASDVSSKLQGTVQIKGTEGLIPFARTYGLDDPFANLAAYTIEDFYAMAGYFRELQVGTDEFGVWQGWKFGQRTDHLLKDYLSDTFVSYVGQQYMGDALKNSNMSAKEMFVTVGFKGINVDNTNFLFSGLGELDDVDVNKAGLGYNRSQLVAPLGYFSDKKTNRQTPIMGYEYRDNPEIGYSRENEIWRQGGAGPEKMVTKTSEFDVMESFFRSEIGTHFGNGLHMIWQHTLAE
jgi:hypothetical protein